MKVLVLENEFVQKDDLTTSVIKTFKEKEYEVQIIEQAYLQDKQILVEAIMSADILLFQTTWLRTEQLQPFGKLLAMAEPMEILCYNMSGYSIYRNLENTFGLSTLAQLSKHKLYQIKHSHKELDDWKEEVDLIKYKTLFDKEEKERIEKNNSFKKTGYKILIKEVQAQGKAFSNLKEGDVVDELDCKEIDPNPKRGVWVMGNGEPVKLLNSDGYNEFEYAEDKCFALARDFYTRGNRADQKKDIQFLASLINGYLQKMINSDETTLWDFCDDVCTMVGVERRGNRHYFESRLKKYLSKHTYFNEIRRDALCFREEVI